MQTISVVSVALGIRDIFWRRKNTEYASFYETGSLLRREKKDFSDAYVPTCREEKSFFSLLRERIY